jgi:hypothetical protein
MGSPMSFTPSTSHWPPAFSTVTLPSTLATNTLSSAAIGDA